MGRRDMRTLFIRLELHSDVFSGCRVTTLMNSTLYPHSTNESHQLFHINPILSSAVEDNKVLVIMRINQYKLISRILDPDKGEVIIEFLLNYFRDISYL